MQGEVQKNVNKPLPHTSLPPPPPLLPLQFCVLHDYMDGGGCVLVLMTEGGELK